MLIFLRLLQHSMRYFISKHGFFFPFLAAFAALLLASCSDDDSSERLLNRRTKQYFDFRENTQWVYSASLDANPLPDHVFTLKRRKQNDGSNNEMGEFISYELREDRQKWVWNYRLEVGLTDFANIISVIDKSDASSQQMRALFWSQSHRFFNERGDSVVFIDTITVNNQFYDEVWRYRSRNALHFREILFAPDWGAIRYHLRDGTLLELKEKR